jgi:hypothetical protein
MSAGEGDFHAGFLRALDEARGGKAGKAASPAQRVYINTGLRASIEALRANYPGVERWLGDESFRLLAGAYAIEHPASDARLFLYGGGLVASLSRSDGEHSLIAALARLDRCWTEAQAECDAPLLTREWIGWQAAATLEQLCLRPAPATRWLASAALPLWDWWQALRQSAAGPQPAGGGGQAVLFTRPDDAVWVQALPPAGAALLQACDRGDALPQALQAAAHADPSADLQHVLGRLFAAGAFQLPEQFIAKAFP